MIDGVPVPFPASEAGIEAVLERLGEDGVEAVGALLTADAECAGRSGKLSRHPGLMDCLYLVSCGVPYEVAFGLDEAERLAHVVVWHAGGVEFRLAEPALE